MKHMRVRKYVPTSLDQRKMIIWSVGLQQSCLAFFLYGYYVSSVRAEVDC